MKNNFIAGLEIHCQLNDSQKMFSYSRYTEKEKPNSLFNNIDIALPGYLPQINPTNIKSAFHLSKILNMKIPSIISFTRKNYFYYDLPKGFQLTQVYNPIGSNGKVNIFYFKDNKRLKSNITIRRIQIEEDTAKVLKNNKVNTLNFNRCGVGLLEIITDPVFTCYEEIVAFLKILQRTIQELGISDAKMENGNMRIDLNVSLKDHFDVKTEIKNLNSFKNLKKSLFLEIDNLGKKINVEKIQKDSVTKTFDEGLGKLVMLRKKESETDYYYFIEPNLPHINITKVLNEEKEKENNSLLHFYQEANKLLINEEAINY